MNDPAPINNNKKEIYYQILQYFLDNPNAQDTAEGIAKWWLLFRTIEYATALVKEVLAILVDDGFVIALQGRGSRTRYKINLDRREQIISLLQQRP